MRILVTGATGFIGNHLIKVLLSKGYQVIASSTDRFKAEKYSWFSSVIYKEYLLGSDRAGKDLFEYFDRPEAMIHLAWEDLTDFKSEDHLKKFLPAQIDFLGTLISHGLKDLTVIGTCQEYGMQEGCLTENMQTNPHTAYAQAKDELRVFLDSIASKRRIVFRWVRLFYLYGEGQQSKSLIPQLEQAVQRGEALFNMSDGEQIRDYQAVETASEQLVKIATQATITGVINCCSGKPVKVKDFVNRYTIEHGLSIKLNLGYYPYPDYEPMEFWGGTEKLAQILFTR